MVAFKISLTLDRAGVAKEGADLVYREVTTVIRQTFNRANVLTPVKFGRLRAGNQMRVKRIPSGATGEVWNHTAYADAVHNGSRAHVVRPKRAKALRFVIGGKVVFAKFARIPARKGRPWILRALREVAGRRGYTITET